MRIFKIKKRHLLKDFKASENLEKLIEEQILKNNYSNNNLYEYKLQPNKQNRRRHYFNNDNYLEQVKKEYVENLKMAIYFMPLLLIILAVLVYFEASSKLVLPILIYVTVIVIGIPFSFLAIKKKLILKNKFIYETDLLGERKNILDFKELNIIESPKICFVYFDEEESPILYSTEKNKKEFLDFFANYKMACDSIKGNRLE